MYPVVGKKIKSKRRLLTVLLIIAILLIAPATTAYKSGVVASDQAVQTETPVEISEIRSYLEAIPNAPIPYVFAKSILLMDGQNGDILYSENSDEEVPVASTTKMTTALTVRKLMDVDETVTVSRFAANIGGSEVNLQVGEKITVKSLLKALLIQSGNDAAFALADHYSSKYGKDYKLFVEEMNKFVKEKGIESTTYGDPAGLDDETGRSTARSLAHTARLLLQDPLLTEIVNIPKTTISSIDNNFSHELVSSNRLIRSDSPYYFPKALGIKTGFTHDAGHCLVAAADLKVGRIIGVVLNTNEYTTTASAAEMEKLFQWADKYLVSRNY